MTKLLTPPGRMVAGSMYKANTTDWQGNPLTTKSGANAGQPREDWFFAIAIPKGPEQHWSNTDWGMVIYNAGVQGFPNGETQRPDFAWKIVDGDSQIPNRRGTAPCTKEGYPGNWVLSFSSGYAPNLYVLDNAGKAVQLMEPEGIKPGFFIQVSGSVVANNNAGNPGVYLNHSMVCRIGYGEEIHNGPDASQVGFGGPLPTGASATPVGGMPPMQGQQQPMQGQQQPMQGQQQPMQGQQQPMQGQQQPTTGVAQGGYGATHEQQNTGGMPSPNNGFANHQQ